jgi:tetratricopeptide (TPR) repeat protein
MIIILVLYEYLVQDKRFLKDYIMVSPFIVIMGIFISVRTVIVGSFPVSGIDAFTFFNTVSVIIKRFVKIFLLPDGPVTIYQKQLFTDINAEVLISYGVIAGLIMAGVMLWSKRKEYLFWYLWFFVWIAVSFNIGKLGQYLMADKLLYLAALGFCVLLAYFSMNLMNKQKIISVVIVSIFIIFHFSFTFSRTLYWRNNVTYFEKVLEFAPTFDLATYYLGNIHASQGKYDRAITMYKRTIDSNPKFSYAFTNMGNVYLVRGQSDNAVNAWIKAINSDPFNPVPYYNIGLVLEERGEMQSALVYYDKYLSLNPEVPASIINRILKLKIQKTYEK